MALKVQEFSEQTRGDFSGGINYYHGPRQVKDNESPNSVNCDFKGRTGVGNREGYSQIGAVTDSRTTGSGLFEYHNGTTDQLIKFCDNGSNNALYHSTGAAWTAVTGTTFTTGSVVDVVQAGDSLYSANGTDAMVKYSGATWAAVSNGKVLKAPAYYDFRIWGIDPTVKDKLWFSGRYQGDNTVVADKLGDFVDASAGWIRFQAGSGKILTGAVNFKNKLYVLLTDSIYRLTTTSTANVFTVELVTSSIGCISFRSIKQVGEDIFFAGDDGVYSLGDVANYLDVRTVVKSAKIQRIFDSMTGTNKSKLCAVYHNFKYHLFYSFFGSSNDSCAAYDVRYKGWVDWRTMAVSGATVFTISGERNAYFIEPTTGEVQKMYSGSTDDGSAITSTHYTKSYDENMPQRMKLYFDSTFIFGTINGSITVTKIFNDTEFSSTANISQLVPQGGYGSSIYGRQPYGRATNSITVVNVVGTPRRLKGKGKKFAVQYRIDSTDQWRLDSITEWVEAFDHFKFLSANKLKAL